MTATRNNSVRAKHWPRPRSATRLGWRLPHLRALSFQREPTPRQYLVVARHGQSEANVQLEKSPDGETFSTCGSDREVPLTALGRTQGRTLAKKLALRFPLELKIEYVYYNQFERVRQFAWDIVDNLDYDVQMRCDARLNKRDYGEFWNLTYKGVQVRYPEEWERYQAEGPIEYRPPGGENYPDLWRRVDSFVDDTINPCSENILVVTSSVVMLSFRRKLEGLHDEDVVNQYEEQTVPNAQAIIYYRDHPSEPWRRLQEPSHKPKPGQLA